MTSFLKDFKIKLIKNFNSEEAIKINAAAQRLGLKIKPLNKKLIRYSKLIFRYKLKINKMILKNIKVKNKKDN